MKDVLFGKSKLSGKRDINQVALLFETNLRSNKNIDLLISQDIEIDPNRYQIV